MVLRINQDHQRFRKIVRGKIRRNLKKYMSNQSIIGQKGKDKISIPIPRIDTPRFKFNDKDAGGVGQGDGDVGDPLGPGENQPGQGKAGDSEGDHILEVDVTIEELASILGEELELPDIKPKGDKNISETRNRYSGIRRAGPEGLRHFKRTYRETLKRQISSGTYNPDNPIFVPERSDKRYRSQTPVIDPMANAVIIYMMDVSGSMGEEQKQIVRTESFWIDAWLTKQYKGLDTRFIIHDSVAREVDRETFFNTRESGGTMISSALTLCKEIIENEYSPAEWNIYPFHFSDGDNWSHGDTEKCIEIIKQYLLPWSNMIAYGQVASSFGSGEFIEELEGVFEKEPKVILSRIDDMDSIMGSIKEFLGKGH